jgi:hypothetical protein
MDDDMGMRMEESNDAKFENQAMFRSQSFIIIIKNA